MTSEDELKEICSEAYIVVGTLASDCGRFDDDHVIKILDNLSEQKIIHNDVLPFPSKALPTYSDIEVEFESLISDYWDAAWHEGKTGENMSKTANETLHKLRELLKRSIGK